MPRRALISLLLAACQGGAVTPNDSAPCTGKCDGAGEIPAAPKLGRCTLVGGSAGHTVRCTFDAPPADFGVHVAKLVVGATKQGDPKSVDNLFGSQTFTASGSADVLTVRTEQLPVFVTVIADLESDRGVLHTQGEEDLSQLSQSYFLRADGDGFAYALPFTAWTLELDATVDVDAQTDGYALDLAPWQTFFDKTSIVHAPALPTLRSGDRGVRAVLVVPASLTQVTGKNGGAGFTIPGPGHYTVGAAGFSRATTAPPAAGTPDAPPAPSGPPDAAPPSSPPDAPPATTDPTCGGDGQAPCHDASGAKTCNADCVYNSWDGVCHACGKADEPRCRDASGNESCDAGFVYNSYYGVCKACGAEGQPRCRDESGNEACNAGFVYNSVDGVCHACGKDGQPGCRDSAGNVFCDEGFTYSSWDGTCHAN
jgi:hypothetical protein